MTRTQGHAERSTRRSEGPRKGRFNRLSMRLIGGRLGLSCVKRARITWTRVNHPLNIRGPGDPIRPSFSAPPCRSVDLSSTCGACERPSSARHRESAGPWPLALAEAGADVIVHGRRSIAGGRGARRELRSKGVRSHVLMADLADRDAGDRLVEEAWNVWGGLDAWLHIAGADTLTGPRCRSSPSTPSSTCSGRSTSSPRSASAARSAGG